jgi:CheY-like chemotaxis protein
MTHLLVVDDNEINNFLLKHMINKSDLDISVSFYIDPEDALSFIKTGVDESRTIDLIFLDINMPLMSGWELLDELKQDGITLQNHTPVYMFTSSVYQTDKEKAKNYPEVCGFLLKPVSLEMLIELTKKTAVAKQELS